MPSFRTIALGLAAVSTPVVLAEHVRTVWSSGSFSSISGPSGSETGHYSGFAIIRDDGEAIYTQDFPDDHSPCYTDDGREFTIEGDCWDTAFKFKCVANLGGLPESCEVKDADGNSLGTGDGQTDTDFIGIAIGTDASCVIEWDTNGDGCPVDEGDGPLHVTEG